MLAWSRRENEGCMVDWSMTRSSHKSMIWLTLALRVKKQQIRSELRCVNLNIYRKKWRLLLLKWMG